MNPRPAASSCAAARYRARPASCLAIYFRSVALALAALSLLPRLALAQTPSPITNSPAANSSTANPTASTSSASNAAATHSPAAATPLDPAKQKAVSSLIAVLRPEKSMQDMVPSARAQFRAVLRQMLPISVDNPLLDTIAQDFADEMSKLDFISLTAKFYADNFSLEELEAMTAFHRSPVGQKLLEITPQLAQASMQYGQKEGERIGQMVLNRHMEAIRKALPPPGPRP